MSTDGRYARATMWDMTERHTPMRPVRIEDGLWTAFGEQVGTRNRSRLIREFIAWYLRTPGAKLPSRPPVKD